MSETGMLASEKVTEGKRPYNRYSLINRDIKISFNIAELKNVQVKSDHEELKIREAKDAGAVFNIARDKKSFSSVVIWIGKGRSKSERKINLTNAQGRFLYNLPFPTADHRSLNNTST